MGAGEGSILCLLPTIRERKLYSHASQISAESGNCSAQCGQFFSAGMRWVEKNRSETQLLVRAFSAVEDLKKLPYFFFANRAVRNTRINAIAEK